MIYFFSKSISLWYKWILYKTYKPIVREYGKSLIYFFSLYIITITSYIHVSALCIPYIILYYRSMQDDYCNTQITWFSLGHLLVYHSRNGNVKKKIQFALQIITDFLLSSH